MRRVPNQEKPLATCVCAAEVKVETVESVTLETNMHEEEAEVVDSALCTLIVFNSRKTNHDDRKVFLSPNSETTLKIKIQLKYGEAIVSYMLHSAWFLLEMLRTKLNHIEVFVFSGLLCQKNVLPLVGPSLLLNSNTCYISF